MDNLYFNRYLGFLINGEQTVIPFVRIPGKPSDKAYFYRKNVTRLDKISQEFYGSPYFGWLILHANPQYGGLEWGIPDNSLLTVPFPLLASVQDYESQLKNHFYYYGR
jgi:hypothetical protein